MYSFEDQQRQARLQAFLDFKVKHPRLEEIDDTLMQAIYGHRTYTLLPIYGAGGVGKSTVLRHVAERCRARETDPSCMPVVEVQASPEDIGASARLDFYRQILTQLRGHVAVNDRMRHLNLATHPGKKSTDPAEWLDMRDAVIYAFALLRVKVVFVDEAQHLMSVDTPHKPTSQLDWLKTLTNRTNVLHVLAGNFDLYDFCHLNGQAGRRMRDLFFSRYHLDNEAECAEFVGALRSLLEHVPLAVDVPGLLAHWRWFGEWSLGCIGVLSDWIVETVDALYRQGATTLTIDALQKHALPPNLRARMESEARAGEFKWEQAKAQSEQELKRLLGNPAPIPGTAPSKPPAENTPQNVSGHAPVQRAAARDFVGDQVQTARTPKCTFSGVVPIEARRFLDSGTRLVECPDCAAMRSLELQKGLLRFKSHDKRKTTTLNTEERWTRVDLVWSVVRG
ncbi:MAG: TniB family NTP-binding protein [Ktedonobacteraceae bacterium]